MQINQLPVSRKLLQQYETLYYISIIWLMQSSRRCGENDTDEFTYSEYGKYG